VNWEVVFLSFEAADRTYYSLSVALRHSWAGFAGVVGLVQFTCQADQASARPVWPAKGYFQVMTGRMRVMATAGARRPRLVDSVIHRLKPFVILP
jgi:hypothetical protein